MIEVASAIFTIATGSLTILATFSKLQAVLSRLETRDLELREEIRTLRIQFDHASDRMELLTNGLKERVEHVNTRLSGQMKDTSSTLGSVEAFLVKNTAYERRSHS
jgi:hypothetical protein